MLFFVFLFIDTTFITIFRPSHKPNPISAWLEPHHQTCLYSSLLFTFTLTLATTIYEFNHETTGVYDSIMMIYNVACTFFSLLVNTVSCYEPIKRPRLFALGLTIIIALSSTASLYVVVTLHGLNVIQACRDFSVNEDLRWQNAAPYLSRREGYVEILTSILSGAVVVAVWLLLRQLLWGGRGEFQAQWNAEPKRRPIARKALAVFLLMLSLATLGLVGVQTWQLFRERTGMDIMWHGTTGDNQWSIGQIGAPLAWAPLITDMFYSASERLTKWWRRKRDDALLGRKSGRILRMPRFWRRKSSPSAYDGLQENSYDE